MIRLLPISKKVQLTLPTETAKHRVGFKYKIPVHEYTSVEGSISDFRSIKFMRMYLNGFTDDRVTIRFAALNLVRG